MIRQTTMRCMQTTNQNQMNAKRADNTSVAICQQKGTVCLLKEKPQKKQPLVLPPLPANRQAIGPEQTIVPS